TTVGDINIGSTASIGAHGIVFDGGTGSGSLLTVTTTGGGSVRVSGAVELDSNLRIVTAGTSDGNITFTNDSSLDSQAGEFNNLALNSGTGLVKFNEDLGSTQRLGSLTVENAAQVLFGEGNTEVPGAGTTGPVTVVNTNGAIDIGSQSVISGGIILNGGAGLLTVTTTND